MVNSMFASEFQLFPTQASSVAASVDLLTLFILAVNVGITVMVMFLLVLFAVIFRRKSENDLPKPIHGNVPLRSLDGNPVGYLSDHVFLGRKGLVRDHRCPTGRHRDLCGGSPMDVEDSTSGGQREINSLHVPVGSTFKMIVTAEDVIHCFSIPDFRVKVDAVPGRYSQMWFTATKPGKYHLYCTEFCGTEHSRMIGWVHVMEREEHAKWLNEQAEGGDGLQGRKLYKVAVHYLSLRR